MPWSIRSSVSTSTAGSLTVMLDGRLELKHASSASVPATFMPPSAHIHTCSNSIQSHIIAPQHYISKKNNFSPHAYIIWWTLVHKCQKIGPESRLLWPREACHCHIGYMKYRWSSAHLLKQAIQLATPSNRCMNYTIYRLGWWQCADSVDEHSKRSLTTNNRTQRQTMKHAYRHTQENLSLLLATVPWCRYYQGHCSLVYVYWPKVGGASSIGYISYNLYAIGK